MWTKNIRFCDKATSRLNVRLQDEETLPFIAAEDFQGMLHSLATPSSYEPRQSHSQNYIHTSLINKLPTHCFFL